MTKKEVIQRATDGGVSPKYAHYFIECWTPNHAEYKDTRDYSSLKTLDYISFQRLNWGAVEATFCHTATPNDFERRLLIMEE